MIEQPPAGFYVDPEDDQHMRWWTGEGWGEVRQPNPDAPRQLAEVWALRTGFAFTLCLLLGLAILARWVFA